MDNIIEEKDNLKNINFIIKDFLDSIKILNDSEKIQKIQDYLKTNNLSYKIEEDTDIILIYNNFNSLGKSQCAAVSLASCAHVFFLGLF